jgi:hypothetical protein
MQYYSQGMILMHLPFFPPFQQARLLSLEEESQQYVFVFAITQRIHPAQVPSLTPKDSSKRLHEAVLPSVQRQAEVNSESSSGVERALAECPVGARPSRASTAMLLQRRQRACCVRYSPARSALRKRRGGRPGA